MAKREFVERGTPTRWSTVQGLVSSPSSEKWRVFLEHGPYWEYMAGVLVGMNVFKGRQDLVAEAVTDACANIGNFICERGFNYPEEGKGYFRAFLKKVVQRCAFDVLRHEAKHEGVVTVPAEEIDRVGQMMNQAAGRGLDERIEPSVTEQDLDEYDKGNSLERAVVKAEAVKEDEEAKKGRTSKRTVRMNPSPYSDDEGTSTFDPAAFFAYQQEVAEADRAWVKKLQVHVIYIALCHLLTKQNMSAQRREMLRLRIGLGKTPGEIYARPDFARLTRSAFDVKMKNAMDDLREEARAWWSLVAPEENDLANEKVMELWRALLGNLPKRKMAKGLIQIAEDRVGAVK